MTYLIGMLSCAALVVLFALIRPSGRDCSGHCAHCGTDCAARRSEGT